MVISSVGYDEQSPLSVSSGPHLVKAQIDTIEERRATFRRRSEQAALQVFNRGGEVAHDLRPFVKTDEEELVLGIGGLEQL
jgi:hypothetical protein